MDYVKNLRQHFAENQSFANLHGNASQDLVKLRTINSTDNSGNPCPVFLTTFSKSFLLPCGQLSKRIITPISMLAISICVAGRNKPAYDFTTELQTKLVTMAH